jgi:hypothetical protein
MAMHQREAFGWLATIGAMALIWLVLLDVVPKPSSPEPSIIQPAID